MLLRRITQHVRDQNWFAVFVDFFIVIIGILIAFQVTEWDAEREKLISQEQIYERLVKDFEIIEQRSDRAVEYMEYLLDSLIVLQDAVNRGKSELDEAEKIKYALERAYSYPAFNDRSGTYIELLSSGQLELIQSEQLRIALNEYDLRVQQSKFNETRIADMLIGSGNLVAFSRHKTFENPARNEHSEIIRGPIKSFDIAAMATDEEFQNELAYVIENRTWLMANVYGQRRVIRQVKAAFED